MSATGRSRLTQQEKVAEAQRISEELQQLLGVHHHEFPPVEGPEVLPPPPVDEDAVRTHFEERELEGISFFRRADRAAARARAEQLAAAEIARMHAERHAAHQEAWHEARRQWEALLANDEEMVIAVLEEAFEGNQAPAAAVHVEDDEVSVLVLAPAEDLVPERLPGVTESGNVSLRRASKTRRAGLYAEIVCGHLLVTVKETLATAPAVVSVRAVVLRPGLADPYGHVPPECLLACRLSRRRLQGVRWAQTDAVHILQGCADDLRWRRDGRTGALRPLGLDDEPELAALVANPDICELFDELGDVDATADPPPGGAPPPDPPDASPPPPSPPPRPSGGPTGGPRRAPPRRPPRPDPAEVDIAAELAEDP